MFKIIVTGKLKRIQKITALGTGKNVSILVSKKNP